ncbi:MAG: DUF6266 family protein, partial [Chitinophagales bacterium]
VEGFLAAKSYLTKNAMEFDGVEWKVNPALMKVSFGTLPLSENIAVKTAEDWNLLFTWDTAEVNGSDKKDQVMLMAYNLESKHVIKDTSGEFRQTGSTKLKIYFPNTLSWHVYFAFIAVDRSRQSDSVYLGEIKF